MNIPEKSLKKVRFSPNYMSGYERFGFTPKKHILPTHVVHKTSDYSYIVDWQLNEETSKSSEVNIKE